MACSTEKSKCIKLGDELHIRQTDRHTHMIDRRRYRRHKEVLECVAYSQLYDGIYQKDTDRHRDDCLCVFISSKQI